MIIMGIDPGLATMGYGIINAEKGVFSVVDYGVVSTPKSKTLPERLKEIEEGVSTLINRFNPECVAIEELFFAKNVSSCIAVAEARGVILLTCAKLVGVEVYEYTPNQIKQGITGYGGADKRQMQLMVQMLLKLAKKPTPDDAADALAVALCHAQTSKLMSQFKVK